MKAQNQFRWVRSVIESTSEVERLKTEVEAVQESVWSVEGELSTALDKSSAHYRETQVAEERLRTLEAQLEQAEMDTYNSASFYGGELLDSGLTFEAALKKLQELGDSASCFLPALQTAEASRPGRQQKHLKLVKNS